MRIAILGAGAMGRLFGARLLLAGEEVTLVDVDAGAIGSIGRDGLTLVVDGQEYHTDASAARAADVAVPQDLVIVFTKGFHTRAAVDSVRHLIGEDTYGLTLQNGLGNPAVLAEAFTPARTLRGMTDFPADLHADGVVATTDDGGVRVGGDPEVDRAALERIVAALDGAGLHAGVEDGIDAAIWEKLAFNCAFNTLCAATGMTVGQVAASGQTRAVVTDVLDEVEAVAGHRRIGIDRARIDAAIDNAYTHHADHKPSMLHDLEAGRRTEIDTIGGAVIALAAEDGIPTPTLATLTRIVRARGGE